MTNFLVYGSVLILLVPVLFKVIVDDYLGVMEKAFLSIVVTVLVALMVGGGVYGLKQAIGDQRYQTDTFKVQSLDTGVGQTGVYSASLFVARGYSYSEAYYYFYVKTPEGGFQMISLAARNTQIIEDDSKEPEVYCYITVDDRLWPFYEYTVEDYVSTASQLQRGYGCQLTIPSGSVTDQIDPNLPVGGGA